MMTLCKRKHIFLEILALIGLVDSIYLSFSGTHFLYFENLCSNTCGQDLTVFGIHIAVYGIIYYTFLFYFGYFKSFKSASILSGLGFLVSCYFLYYQIAVIKGVCIFCLISFVCTALYLITASLILYKNKKTKAIGGD